MEYEDRFWSKVDAVGPCWLWVAAVNPLGYGRYRSASGRAVLAHRHSWESLVGPISTGLVVDHLCRVPACVNTDHLEPVTQRENSRRGAAGAVARLTNAARELKALCDYGHPMDGVRSRGGQYCKTCNRERAAANYQRYLLAQAG